MFSMILSSAFSLAVVGQAGMDLIPGGISSGGGDDGVGRIIARLWAVADRIDLADQAEVSVELLRETLMDPRFEVRIVDELIDPATDLPVLESGLEAYGSPNLIQMLPHWRNRDIDSGRFDYLLAHELFRATDEYDDSNYRISIGVLRLDQPIIDPHPTPVESESTELRLPKIEVRGHGFFVVEDSEGETYFTRGSNVKTRDGQLQLANGRLLLQGYSFDSGGQISAELETVDISTVWSAPQRTGSVNFKARLSSTAPILTEPFDASTYRRAIETSQIRKKFQVFTEFGSAYTAAVLLRRTLAYAWDYYIIVDGMAVSSTGSLPIVLYKGRIYLDQSGSLSSSAQERMDEVDRWCDGAPMEEIAIDFDGSTMAGSLSRVEVSEQDGHASGYLLRVIFQADGTLRGVFDNGVRQRLYRIPLATFASPYDLMHLGNGVYRETSESGSAQIGLATSHGRGRIRWTPGSLD